MLNKILKLAQSDDSIRAILLTGSRSSNLNLVDIFSDYDLSVFVTNQEKYTHSDFWMAAIDEVLVYIPEKISIDSKTYPTRLVIFKDGIKVDFAFYPVNFLKDICLQNKLPVQYNLGYKVLIDKDKLTCDIKQPNFKMSLMTKPSEQVFKDTVNEFFFEVYHVAKHLYRNDLWHAKFRDLTTKELLLRMIEWHEKSVHGWDYDTQYQGKHMQSWVDKKTWTTLDKCFAHFDTVDSWKALIKTIELFRRVGKQTAENLGYKYPAAIDKNITEFVQKIVKEFR